MVLGVLYRFVVPYRSIISRMRRPCETPYRACVPTLPIV